ncbi:Alkaline serine protease [Myxococcus hansupus]|uniref:Alkaline serine protease n=1 Tax=Pseudomyxococcus hansupus TaxID=1297742 RepID=A0A0H4WLB2_9BACT|nr:Alkaline serine protease [Myxococcus hansupus]
MEPQEPAPSSAQEIVNGTDTTIGDNPWQAMLYFNSATTQMGRRVCGGSILNEKWILTAQHCVLDKYGNLIEPDLVMVGSTTLDGVHHGQTPTVEDVIPYPGFLDTSSGKDVALVLLATPLDLSGPNAKAIPLITPVDESSRVTTPGVVARATGWGAHFLNDTFNNTLRTTNLIIQSNSVAQAAYPTHHITEDQIPAAALGTGICDGDSGGPLTVPYGDTRALAGVLSWGYGCGDSRFPGMSARVSSFGSWITSTTCILTNGASVPVIDVDEDDWTCTYTLSVPEGASDLKFELSSSEGDGDVYVRFGAEPDAFTHPCDSANPGNGEKCTIDYPSVGTYSVKIHVYASANDMRLKAGYSSLLDFGGMWGYVDNGVLAHHPATGSDTCPVGYKPTRLLGSVAYPGRDGDVFLCSRPQKAGRAPLYDFGGMWGYVLGAVMPNPYTLEASCPEGYTDQRVLGTPNVDYEVHVCYRPHGSGTTPSLPFGGMMGQVDGGKVAPNPATGAASCPTGFVSRPVSGYPNVDWSLHFCYQPPTRWDFGGMWGSVNGGTSVDNPATDQRTCPAGYKATQLLGTRAVDFSVFLCSRPSLGGNNEALHFGGMWGTVNGVLRSNPYTNSASCPSGYTATRVLGTPGLDANLHYCHMRNMSKTPAQYPFGGMWGQVNGGTYVPNPSTGAISCPPGFTDRQVLGTNGLDYELHFCSKP